MAASGSLDGLVDLERDANSYVEELKGSRLEIRKVAGMLEDAEKLIQKACDRAKQLKDNVSSFVMPDHNPSVVLDLAKHESNRKIEVVRKVSAAQVEDKECSWIHKRYAESMQSNVNDALTKFHEHMEELNCRYSKRHAKFGHDSEIVSNVGVDLFQKLPDEMVVHILSMVGNPCVQRVCRRFKYLYVEAKKKEKIMIEYRYMQPNPLAYRVAMPSSFRVCPSTKTETQLVSGSGISFLVDERSLTVGENKYNPQSVIFRIYIGQSLLLFDVEGNRLVFDLKNERWFDWAKIQLNLMNDSDPITYEAVDLDTDNIVFWRGNRFVVCNSAGEVLKETDPIHYERPYHVDAGYGRIVAGFDCSVSESPVHVHVIFCATTGKKLFERSTTYGLAYNCAFGVIIEAYFERWYILGQKVWKRNKSDLSICCIGRDGDFIVSEAGESKFCHETSKVYKLY